ncbi:MAG: type II toxin-antitoxin system VapC family toxin [Caulobacter sp.]
MTLVLDSSALIAILLSEPERDGFIEAILKETEVVVSAAILHETRLVFARRKGLGDSSAVDDLVDQLGATVEPFDRVQADLAFEAFVRFGAGRHGLNLMDCAAYALARSLDAPLLFKGEDFARTDVRRAG